MTTENNDLGECFVCAQVECHAPAEQIGTIPAGDLNGTPDEDVTGPLCEVCFENLAAQ